MKGRAQGMSLIELLIVVAVVGILAGIAYPNYSERIKQAARAEVAGLLFDSAQRLQRHYSRAGGYADTEQVVTALPSGTLHYQLEAVREADAFRLVAKRRTQGSMATDPCGDFALDHRGVKGNPNQAGAAGARCWGS